MSYTIQSHQEADLSSLGITTGVKVHLFHVKINKHEDMLIDFMNHLGNTSWISEMGALEKKAYEANAIKSVKKIVDDIIKADLSVAPKESVVVNQSGQYIVSYTAQKSLNSKLNHTILPLSELFKEKLLGNPGFDFHTETPTAVIAFGESKYSSKATPAASALAQVQEFIKANKADGDWIFLRDLISPAAKTKFDTHRSYAVAFTLNCKDIDEKLKSLVCKDVIDPLKNYEEIFLIGIEI